MSQDILVRGSDARGQRTLFRILAALVLLGATSLFWGAELRALGIAVGLVGLTMLVVSELVAVSRRRGRRWVGDTGYGFRWYGGTEDVTVADAHATAIRFPGFHALLMILQQNADNAAG